MAKITMLFCAAAIAATCVWTAAPSVAQDLPRCNQYRTEAGCARYGCLNFGRCISGQPGRWRVERRGCLIYSCVSKRLSLPFSNPGERQPEPRR